MKNEKSNEKLNYVEFPAKDIPATKQFFSTLFAWNFEDYGPEYTAFFCADSGLDGGFYRSEMAAAAGKGSALLVFYSADLEATLQKIKAGGGEITRKIFSFPGGRRFHFTEPSGNEFAVWGI